MHNIIGLGPNQEEIQDLFINSNT